MLTGALGGASGSLPFAAAKAGVDAPAPGDHKRFFCLSFFNFSVPSALTAQGYYQYQAAAQDPAQYYYQPVAPAQDQGWATSE